MIGYSRYSRINANMDVIISIILHYTMYTLNKNILYNVSGVEWMQLNEFSQA